MFELSTRYAKDQITFDVTDPVTKAPTGMSITLASRYSKQARAAQHAIANEQLARKEGDKVRAEQLDDQLLELMAACTIGWSGFTVEGVEPACNPTSVAALYGNPQTAWIREQAQKTYMDIGAFFSPAQSDSALSSDTSSSSASQ